jgi:hypothetical protein
MSTVGHLCVVNVSGTLRGWFSGNNGINWGIGYATSPDGMSWTKYPGNPVMARNGNGWEKHDNFCPWVILNGTCYQMWYAGVDDSVSPWVYKYGYAEGWNNIPNAPGLKTPYDNTWAVNNTPIFSWTFSDPDQYDTQTAYQIQLDESIAFDSIDHDSGKVDSASASYTPATAIADGIYYWRARVWDSDGDNSTWNGSWRIKMDLTGPLNPVGLWSRSHTIGKWSNDNTIEVNWSLPDGGALISGYDSVSVDWDTNGSTVPDIIPEMISDVLSAMSPPMPDGNNIYFHIRAHDRAGNWAAGAAHLGPFLIDISPPQNPSDVRSPSHTPSHWSNDNTMDMTWSDAYDSLSGVEGYSFVWDNQTYTIPQPVLNVSADVLSVSSPPMAEGNGWFFHVRTRDNAGNWALSTVHRGPYIIDSTAPTILNLTVNGGAEFSSCRTARANLRAADSPGGSGLSGIRHRFNDGDWSEWEIYNESFFFDMTGADRQWTVEVQVRDWANNTSPTATATILLDTGTPVVTGIQINQGANLTNSKSVVLSISIDDPLPSSGVDSMSFSKDGINWDQWEKFCETRSFNLTSGDGTKTVHVRMRDKARNIGLAANATIILDTMPPVTFIPMLPSTVDDLNFTVSWTGADGKSGVDHFDIQYSDDGGAWTDWLLATRANTAVFTGQDGHNYSFRARARDRAGNLEAYPASAKNSVLVDIPRPVVTIIKPSVGSTLAGRFTFTGTAGHPKAGLSVQRVQLRFDNGSWLDTRGTAGWSFSFDTDRLGNGKHLISVRAFDGSKYSVEEMREFTVRNGAGLSLGAFPLIIFVIVLAVAIAGGTVVIGMSKRDRNRKDIPRYGKEDHRAPPNQPAAPKIPAPQRALAGPTTPIAPKMTVAEKVSIADLDEEEMPSSTGLQTAPPPEPARDEKAVPHQRDEMAMREGKILKTFSSLPRGLPSSLWGIELDDLASKVVGGERRDSPDGDMLVKIGHRWYYGDEANVGTFMQEYKK